MDIDEAVKIRIRQLSKEKNISIMEIRSTVGYTQVWSLLYGKRRNPNLRTLVEICYALDITLYDFFDDPIFKTKDIVGLN